MKKFRIYHEIHRPHGHEIGTPRTIGLCLTLGKDTDQEATADEYRALMERVSSETVLKAAMLDKLFSAADCRIISHKEFSRKYGEVQP